MYILFFVKFFGKNSSPSEWEQRKGFPHPFIGLPVLKKHGYFSAKASGPTGLFTV